MKKSFLTLTLALGLFVVVSAQPRQQRSPEERAKITSEMMTKQLSLSEEQKKQVYEATLERFKSLSALREKTGEGKRPDMAEMKKIQDEYIAKIEKSLSPKQKEDFEKAQQAMRDRGGDRRQGREKPGQEESNKD